MLKEKAKERIILGIDPGTSVMGYGLVKEVKSLSGLRVQR